MVDVWKGPSVICKTENKLLFYYIFTKTINILKRENTANDQTYK